MTRQVIPPKCDVLIIGGGPAGSMAASLLAQDGFDVVLLEKAHFPRPTVGESFIPFFWKFTDLIGASERIMKEGFIKKRGGVGMYEQQLKSVDFKDYGFRRTSYHVERDVFDNLLLNISIEKGARVFQGVAVTKVSDFEDPVIAYKEEDGSKGEIKANFVVDCSGQQSVVGKASGVRHFDTDFRFQSVWGYFKRSRYIDPDFTIHEFSERFDSPPATGIIHLKDWGWIWHIVLRECVSIGYIIPSNRLAHFKEGGENMDDRIRTAVANTHFLEDMVDHDSYIPGSALAIRDYAYYSTSLTVGKCFLAGDAAGFVDPINSAGVPLAMYGGFMSYWAINNTMKNPSRIDFYRQIFNTHYQQRLRLFRVSAFPAFDHNAEFLESYRDIFNFNSKNDLDLTVSNAILANRSENVRYLLDVLEIPYEIKTHFKSIPSAREFMKQSVGTNHRSEK